MRAPSRFVSRARRPALALVTLSLLVVGACRTSAEGVRDDEARADAPAEDAAHTAAPREPVSITVDSSRIEIGDDVPPDPEVLAFLAPEAATVRARAQRVVGRLAGALERGKPESSLGNFVTDAMREGTTRVTGKDVDVCFTNSGGLRRDLDKGDVTEGLLVELMPFDNSIVVFEATPAQLEAIIARLAQRGDPVSGLRYTRSGGKAREVVVGKEPLGKQRAYRVCTNDYIFEGGGGYPFEGVSRVSYTGVLLRDVLIQQFELAQRAGKAIVPALDGRVQEAK